MTPAEEIEYIIRESITHDFDGISKSYKITSFPETHLMKFSSCYKISIMKNYYQNAAIIKKYEEVRNIVNNRKIIIKNKIIDKDRGISMGGVFKPAMVPIYYKDCVFTDHNVFLAENCENCIVERQ